MKLRILAATAAVMCITSDGFAAIPQPSLKARESQQSSIEEQNQVNQEFLDRVTKGPSGTSGVWYRDSNGSFIRFKRDGDTYERSLLPINRDGQLAPEIVTSFTLDRARGTVLFRTAGKSYFLRYSRETKDSYRGQMLAELDATADNVEAGNVLNRFTGDRWQLIPTSKGESSERVWMTPAMAQARQASKVRELAKAAAGDVTNSPQSATQTTQWGLFSKLIGTEYTVYKGTENAGTMRFVWQVPGRSIRIQLLRAGAWVDDDLIERTDDPTVFRQIQRDGAVGSAHSLSDGRIVWKYPTGNTAAWSLSGGRLAISQVTNGYKWFSYYFAENPEGQAALAAAGPEAYKLPYQDELAAATEQENIERANSEAQDAELEAEAAAKRSAWNAMAARNEQALTDSLQNLNNTVSNIQAQQQGGPAPHHDMQGRTEQASSGSLQVSSTPSTAAIPAATRPAPGGSNAGASEHVMGFLGATCEVATENAHRHFGAGSSFRVAHSRPDGNMCLVQVDVDSVVRGASGTASGQ